MSENENRKDTVWTDNRAYLSRPSDRRGSSVSRSRFRSYNPHITRMTNRDGLFRWRLALSVPERCADAQIKVAAGKVGWLFRRLCGADARRCLNGCRRGRADIGSSIAFRKGEEFHSTSVCLRCIIRVGILIRRAPTMLMKTSDCSAPLFCQSRPSSI